MKYENMRKYEQISWKFLESQNVSLQVHSTRQHSGAHLFFHMFSHVFADGLSAYD